MKYLETGRREWVKESQNWKRVGLGFIYFKVDPRAAAGIFSKWHGRSLTVSR